MLPKQYRLTSSRDFARLHKQGHSWSNSYIVMCMMANGLPCSRFGFSVSRRVGNAVARNRCKRLLREVVQLHLPHIISGYDVLFIARKGMPGTFQETEQAVLELLKLADALIVE